ncbi:MAG TPA: CpsD/CapB family tyrosine-protein kinase [Casimicrobiaceae bacterium]|nr:CpsD/CapB family tyrosine-protein kinase [Casimicrobiaceae bacterium]
MFRPRDKAAASARTGSMVTPDALRLAGAVRAALAEADRVITVLAGEPGEGVSAIVAQLGAAIATTVRESVLVVDANLRNPALHHAFAVARSPGLADLVLTDATLEAVLRDTSLPHLAILASGEPGAGGAESILQHERFAAVVAAARQRFRYVLLDCPPMLRFADWVPAAQAADAAVLVLRAPRRTKQEAAEMTRLLRGLNTKVLGAVISEA